DAEAPGASRGSRSLCPRPLDGRCLGELFDQLQPPLRSSQLFGGMTVASADYPDYLRVLRDPGATLRVMRHTAQYCRDRIAGARRGYRIANGQALVARLAQAAIRHGAILQLSSPVEALETRHRRVTGAVVMRPEGAHRITAHVGVVLASGGVTGDQQLAGAFLDNLAAGQTHLRLVGPGVRGDGWRLALAAGAQRVTDVSNPCAWVPASRVPLPGGGHESFPHFIERAKPGVIAVNSEGRRFANEADTYHRFARALVEQAAGRPEAEGWIIADHRALRRFGVGAVPPWPAPIKPYLDRGYLRRAGTITDLASAIGLPPSALDETIAAFNRHAREGRDPAFGRGQSGINRHYGDPRSLPNPSLGPLEQAPFYAVRILPSDIGGFVGVRADARARALDGEGQPIPGLYVAGNDAASPFGGAYPAGGATIGPAMVFGALAALDMCRTNDADIPAPSLMSAI
ncbi:MAG: FAD-binding protein, partial [Erythrobacter sp.]|uniref:FAD-binding protein n=1 Tax=Erythrobacter sp. TaxID=1042 RepID=UPI0025D1D672